LKATTAVYFTPDGRDINNTGISPDVVAPDDPVTTGVDETVEEALELISGDSTAPSSTTSTTATSTTGPASTSTTAPSSTTVPSTIP
jgi:C-terminal processing protease CtpA/Prc